MARPSKLTPECQDRICAAIREGSSLEEAADGAQVSPRTMRRWMERGERTRSGPARAFYLAVMTTLRTTKARLLAVVERASRHDARAAMYLLARNYDRATPRRRDPLADLLDEIDRVGVHEPAADATKSVDVSASNDGRPSKRPA
jgi:hypothetical protein